MVATTQKALVLSGAKGQLEVTTDYAVPKIRPDAVLVEVKAVALNPVDWKFIDGHFADLKPGDSVGNDFAGVIVEVGKSAKGFQVGDAVAGFVNGGITDPATAAFAQYVATPATLIWHKPANVTFEQAASMGTALSTAAYNLYTLIGIPTPWSSDFPGKIPPRNVLIWGGSTAVGLFAIHLAKLSGVKVISTSSPRNFELLQSLGADEVLDYRDPDVVTKIKKWTQSTGQKLQLAFDTVSEHGSTELVAESTEPGTHIHSLLPVSPPEGSAWPNQATATFSGVDSALDKKENEEGYHALVEWYKHLTSLASSGTVKSVVPLQVGRGLENIPEGLDLLRSGKVSAKKLVYVI